MKDNDHHDLLFNRKELFYFSLDKGQCVVFRKKKTFFFLSTNKLKTITSKKVKDTTKKVINKQNLFYIFIGNYLKCNMNDFFVIKRVMSGVMNYHNDELRT